MSHRQRQLNMFFMVYRMFFPGHNFVSGLLCKRKPNSKKQTSILGFASPELNYLFQILTE